MPEDRDQLFEKALARQLRADAAADAYACLDSETLAAYHERLLSAEEMAAAKDHLVGCARCQEILAQLELTQNLVEAHDQQTAPVMALRSAGAAETEQEAALSAKPLAGASTKVPQLAARKRATLRWVAPLGAIAALLLLSVGLRQHRVPEKASNAPVQIALNNDEQYSAPAQPAVPPSEGRQKASPQPSSDDKRARELPSNSLKDEPQNLPMVQPPPAAQTRTDSLQSMEGSGVGAGAAAPLEKSKQAEKGTPPAKPTAADSAIAGGAVGGIGGAPGGATAKKAHAPSVAIARKEEAKTLNRDEGAFSAAKPDSAANETGARIYDALPAPLPPAPPRPSSRVPGQLRGKVTDSSGAVVPGASIALKSENGSTVAQTSTDQSGIYSFNGVATGSYDLELQSKGFKTDAITGLNIAGGENVQNAQLQVGAVTETVEVSASAPAVLTSGSQAAQVSEVAELSVSGRNFRALIALRPGLVALASPDRKSAWQFGDAGQILYSKDRGQNWTAQSSSVTAKLLAGSAPSAKVCWIAGAGGTLLRTKDSGKHWLRVVIPITSDLGGVRASDGQHATIWDAANNLRYETSDAGATWQPASN